MNVLKPDKKTTVITLLKNRVSQREISINTGVDRKTIRKYGQWNHLIPSKGDGDSKSPTLEGVATGYDAEVFQNPPPWPPAHDMGKAKIPVHAQSACEAFKDWIEQQVRLGRNAMSIYQDLVELHGFTHKYNSVKRFVRKLKSRDPEQFDRLEFLPGEEAQVDYGSGARTLRENGKYGYTRLFIMTLKDSGRAFRKTVWKSSKETWCRLHEQAFRYFGGCPQYIVLDNLKEGVLTPDIYEPELNPLYGAMLAHYGVAADPARVGDPNRKGTVENAVQYTKNTALKGRVFESIEAQNEWLMHWEERWASKRIHGRTKCQVEARYQEEKRYLLALPLTPFRYFEQGVRTVNDDGTVLVDKSYYSALPAPLYSKVGVRIYEHEIEIFYPHSMEVIRRHARSTCPGSVSMEEEDRIFNPSRQTNYLLAKAENIGPYTCALCKKWFSELGRTGHRKMYGVVNMVRHYEARHVEKAAKMAFEMELESYKALRRLVESMAVEAREKCSQKEDSLTQEHPLIRKGTDYGAFWKQHASGITESSGSGVERFQDHISREQLPEIWKSADWRRIIEAFRLKVDAKRSCQQDEIWIKSPFTGEEKASLHVHLRENVFKDFSSGKGGGVMQFCQEMFRIEGQEKNIYEVARWMLSHGISSLRSTDHARAAGHQCKENNIVEKIKSGVNPPIKVDLRSFLQSEHPELYRRGISSRTCHYLGCGFLPIRGNSQSSSPLSGRLVFQIRGVEEHGKTLRPIILSHSGRALNPEEEESRGKYWSYPFRKGLEIYNQDLLLLDMEARHQAKEHGLILVEGFFDVAALFQAGCLNAGALMGSSITGEQIERLKWIHSRLRFPHITLFLDRDEPGINGTQRAGHLLRLAGFTVKEFDWNQEVQWTGHIPKHIKDPADMPSDLLQWLRDQKRI